jgi:hypothetical protein
MNSHTTIEKAAGVPLPDEDCAELLTTLEQLLGTTLINTIEKLTEGNIGPEGVTFTSSQWFSIVTPLNSARAAINKLAKLSDIEKAHRRLVANISSETPSSLTKEPGGSDFSRRREHLKEIIEHVQNYVNVSNYEASKATDHFKLKVNTSLDDAAHDEILPPYAVAADKLWDDMDEREPAHMAAE